MQILLVAAGRRDPFEGATADYLARAEATGRQLGLTGPILKTIEAPRALSGPARQAREAQLLLDVLPEKARVVLLDERGKDVGSRAFANLIGREREAGAASLAFLVGGADGFDSSLLDSLGSRVAARVAFGRATWPHMLVRLMLAEQLYRATTILSGHPYHRD
ncbi:23S rRNA (pseudouridine(1915)-N(3))-methyltransferase RlmH [Parvularcula dongshanensis]|uniref:Ribosomal RNA large subunit methyltransferase H n=1 Tax=Parvularcula dongshanensis TaxID=1173995 RepID=A0A840I214_9PROT|nr:23S rRNA (pseudouridine1915-N3)-methyltransferase [Parvularcula dongshanensis]